jgi:hypothetical protein
LINIIYLICFLLPLPGTVEEMHCLYDLDIQMENQQGKTYIGQVQANCFCQVNILDPNYVSPSNEQRHIVLIWFFLPLPLLLLMLLLSEAFPDHNFFSSPEPKVQVNYCHHLASVVRRLLSVVCKLFTFQDSSPKPQGRLEPNIAGMFLGWSSTKLLFFVPVRYSIWLPGPIICSDWPKFQRSSSLKLMNWLSPNCKWMIIGMSFTKFTFFMSIGNPRWPPSQDID